MIDPVARTTIHLFQECNEKPHLGRKVVLLRVYALNVVTGQGELVQHRSELAAGEFTLNLPQGTPADTQPLHCPVEKQLAVIAVQIPGYFDRNRLSVLLESPSSVLATLEIECQAIVLGMVFID